MEQEIKIVKSGIDAQTGKLNQLLSGTQYKNRDLPITRGYGEMADSVNMLFEELQTIERILLETVMRTKESLEKAGIAFVETDENLGKNISGIGSAGGR